MQQLLCFSVWSMIGYVKLSDIKAVVVLLEVGGEEVDDELEERWDDFYQELVLLIFIVYPPSTPPSLSVFLPPTDSYNHSGRNPYHLQIPITMVAETHIF